jgi:tetratricopeptide (TPR) repeat protein
MQYDRLGFPIPREFESPQGGGRDAFPVPRHDPTVEPDSAASRRVGAGKRFVVWALLALGVVPALALPVVLPLVREAAVQWAVERAVVHEARGHLAAAVADVGRAIAWSGADVQGRGRLLCWRAMLLLENRQAKAAVAEASRAAAAVPTAALPRRTRALAHVVTGDAEAALADAAAAVELSGPGNPEALNHRAYIRALVGRELEAALADVEAALAGSGAESPEFLDTRGFILHLLGRHQEAIDDLNQAIGSTQQTRREVASRAGRVDPDELAYRLRSIDHGLAVMHHHRGLACRAIGLDRQAAQDFEIAERKGFDPARGVL